MMSDAELRYKLLNRTVRGTGYSLDETLAKS